MTETIEHIVVSIATIIGGLWVLSRLVRERVDEAALEMTLSHSSCKVEGNTADASLVLFSVELTNKGKTIIQAKTARTEKCATMEGGYIYEDKDEKLRNACSLQIKKLDGKQLSAGQRVDWFEPGPWASASNTEHSILTDYQNPAKKDEFGEIVEFWIEPGETYRLTLPVVLPKGTYLSKLTFIGEELPPSCLFRLLQTLHLMKRPGPDENFWSQIYGFTVSSS